MDGTATASMTRELTKKDIRKIVYAKLSGALAEYKGSLSEKKFETKLKKASKLFAVDISKAYRKNAQPKVKKKAKVKEIKVK